MVNVICVLRTGIYNIEYVWNLKRGIERNTTLPINFVCLTDTNIDFCTTIKLKHDWPGWWSKIELFRPDLLNAPCIYFDLDTVIIGNIDELLLLGQQQQLHALRGFNQKFAKPGHTKFASGIMAGNFGNYSGVYNKFARSPGVYMPRYIGTGNWRHGDQGFVADTLDITIIPRLQDKLPTNYIISKRRAILRKSIPKGCKTIPDITRVIAWSGEPRLHALESDNKIKQLWQGLCDY